jgi:hypothetical protein
LTEKTVLCTIHKPGKEHIHMEEELIGKVFGEAFKPLVRLLLLGVAGAGLVVAAIIGIPTGFFLAHFLTWPLWLYAMPGTGWALLVASFLLWESIDSRPKSQRT